MRTYPVVLATSLLLAPSAAAAQGNLLRQHAPRPTAPAITAGDLMTRLYLFADDSMQGRLTGEPGELRATAYIEREVRRLGLEPAGDSGGYFQAVPLVRRAVSKRTSLSVDGQMLRLGEDFVPLRGLGESRTMDGVQVVYGGEVQDPGITAEQAAGKFVLIAAPSLEALNRTPPRMGAQSPFLRAAAVGFVLARPIARSVAENYLRPLFSFSSPPVLSRPPGLFLSTHAGEVLFGAPLAGAQPGTTGRIVRGSIDFEETATSGRNVVGLLRGRDSRLHNQYVVLGAHSDHDGVGSPVDPDSIRAYNAVMRPMGNETRDTLTPTPAQQSRIRAVLDSLRKLAPDRRDSIFNGADDDGSGSVAMLEFAERLASEMPRPRRSILFVWHTGEEEGALGSKWFTQHPTVPRDSIVALLELDMVGRGGAGDGPGGGPDYLQLVGSRRLSSELGDIVEAVNRGEPQPFTLHYDYDAAGEPHNIYCRGDHASYVRFGIPITAFFTGFHADYHQVSDEPGSIDYPKLARITQLVHDVTVRVAELDHRLVVDRPRPAPGVPCVQ